MADQTRILIVDDEADTVGLLELTLQPAGYLTESSFNGFQAIEKIKNEQFDLVLLDIMMPELSGFDVIRTLNEEAVPLPPVVFLTARGRTVDIETGNSLGAAGYLVKPATRGQLLDAISAALYESSAEDALD